MGCLVFPPIAFLSPEDDCLFDLLGRPDLWHLEPPAVQTRLTDMSASTQIKDGLIYKQVNSAWLPYIRPSARTDAIMEGHTQIGHGAVRKTHEWLRSRCYWEGMVDTI